MRSTPPSLNPVLDDIQVIVVSPEEASFGVAEFWAGDRQIGITCLEDGELTLRIGSSSDDLVLGAQVLVKALAEEDPPTRPLLKRKARMKVVVIRENRPIRSNRLTQESTRSLLRRGPASRSALNSSTHAAAAKLSGAGQRGVSIRNFKFVPGTITVEAGARITISNRDSTAHTVTSDDGSSFDTGDINPGSTTTITVNGTGRIANHCSIHPFMHGAIVVRGAQAS